jgi:hypothetical protein
MKDFLEFTFDFFVHVLPGSLVIIAISLLFIPIGVEDGLEDILGKFETTKGIAFAVFAFVIGLAVNPLGKTILKKIGFTIWKPKILNNVDMFVSDKFVLIREHSSANFKYVEKWNMYCSLSHNLSFACLILVLVSLIKLILQDPNQMIWLSIIIICTILFFIFLKSAVTYSIWAQHDLNAAISALKLKEKAEDS